MEIQLALSPNLGLSPPDFAAAWNETPDCRAVAQARLDRHQPAQYGPQAAIVILEMLAGMAFGVAGNALYDLVKEVLKSRSDSQVVAVDQVELPDGSRLVIVKPIAD
jgi:hypothetical protein